MNRPPPAIACLHVLEFAVIDDTVKFTQRHTLSVGGEWLGPVPAIAICEKLDRSEIFVCYCDGAWKSQGVAAGYTTIDDAKSRVERSYEGLRGKWMLADYSLDDAIGYIDDQFSETTCAFCHRDARQFQKYVGEEVRICVDCIDRFHEAIHTSDEELDDP
jgi:ClpX C4-type zinc finger